MLRVYFRNNRKLVSKISRLINDMILSYYKASAGKKIQSAAVFAFQSYGDFIRFNPHYHSPILEGGFDDNKKDRESLAQYIVRCPISLKKIMYEPFKGKVIFHTNYNAYFKENTKLFDAADFIAEITQHIPPLRTGILHQGCKHD